jgi:asparagine synthase (glutamine-hydrolysing)
MSESIECRVPFLTPELIGFCLSLPEEHLIAPDGTSKAVFRRAMRGVVPDAVLDRPDKVGYRTPWQRWLLSDPAWVDGVLAGVAGVPALEPRAVLRTWERARDRGRLDERMWRWVSVVRWAERLGVTFP